jgi:hypothetical protein
MMKVVIPVPNNLRQLEQIKVKLEQTEDKATKVALAIKATELVLPIYEYYYPKDKRVRNSIEAAKRGEYDTGAYAANDAAVNDAAAYAAAAAAAAYAAYAATAAITAANAAHFAAVAAVYAIEATKEHFKLK